MKMKEIYIDEIKKKLVNNYDIKYRDINTSSGCIHVIFCKTMSDRAFISMHITKPLMENKELCTNAQSIKDNVITSAAIDDITSVEQAIGQIISGSVVIILGNSNEALFCETKGFNTRSSEVPPTESVIKGPREGFTENLDDCIAHMRRRIRNSELKLEYISIGTKSKTPVVMVYIQNIAPEKLVNHVREKLIKIQVESINYINTIEEALKNKGTPFDTIGYSEKPDIVALKVDEGRVVVMMNGSPFALIAPYFFLENFHTADDYTLNKSVSFLGRFLRWFGFLSAMLLPGLYIALFSYHFKLVPYVFVFGMARSRVTVPFPLAVEALIMIIFFQILREAGVRLPQQIGPSLSIVGALILGDAAVKSGIASQVTVLIIAITSITTFLIPGLFIATFMWSITIITFSALLGLPGFFTSFILFCAHMSSLTTCGYPYMYPAGTLKVFKYKDIYVRGDSEEINQSIFKKDGNK
jgi:spore germination protein KA